MDTVGYLLMVNDRLVNKRERKQKMQYWVHKQTKTTINKQTKTQYNWIRKTKQKWALGVLNVYVFCQFSYIRVTVVVFNATFNTISVMSWRSVSLVENTGVPGENHRPVASHWKTFSHNVVTNARDSHSQHQWWCALIAQVVVYPSTILSPASVLKSSHI